MQDAGKAVEDTANNVANAAGDAWKSVEKEWDKVKDWFNSHADFSFLIIDDLHVDSAPLQSLLDTSKTFYVELRCKGAIFKGCGLEVQLNHTFRVEFDPVNTFTSISNAITSWIESRFKELIETVNPKTILSSLQSLAGRRRHLRALTDGELKLKPARLWRQDYREKAFWNSPHVQGRLQREGSKAL